MLKEQSAHEATPIPQNSELRLYLLGLLRIERAGVAIQLPRRKMAEIGGSLLASFSYLMAWQSRRPSSIRIAQETQK